LYNRAAEAIVNHRALKRCELLGELIEADPDVETLSYFPYLLAWDLERLPEPHPRAAVFLDTYENAGGRHHRDFERFLQRSVFLMPNVLFVITGRNRIDWADVDELDFPGPERWPGLHADNQSEEPRQHLVGYLSADDDADDYLRKAMVKGDTPVMDAAIRERIVAAGSGLPLYLDLAVTRYLDLLARGRTPTAEDFGQPLRTVAARVLRDLGQYERELLRTAALLDTFDMDLLRAACPAIPDAALRNFKDRSFLEVNPEWTWPYALHQVLRDALREADVDLADSWSPRERAEVADRINDHLGQVRFCSPQERISLRHLNESTYEARVRCTSDGKPFEALIVTSWQVTDAARRTSLRFASGAELLLDHHAVAAYLVQKGRITDQFGTDGSVPRRESHYVGLYHRRPAARRPLMPSEQRRRLHDVLLWD